MIDDTSQLSDVKQCSKGKECVHPSGPLLPKSEFYKDKAAADHLTTWCKECHRVDRKRRYLIDRADPIKYEKVKSQSLAYYRNHKSDPEFQKRKREAKARSVQSPESKERVRLYKKKYAARAKFNIDLVRRRRFSQKRSNSIKRGAAVATLTYEEWLGLLEQCGYRCAYCGAEFDYDHLTIDHIIPLGHGGNHTLANVAPCCYWCNIHKKSSRCVEFAYDIAAIKAPHQLNLL